MLSIYGYDSWPENKTGGKVFKGNSVWATHLIFWWKVYFYVIICFRLFLSFSFYRRSLLFLFFFLFFFFVSERKSDFVIFYTLIANKIPTTFTFFCHCLLRFTIYCCVSVLFGTGAVYLCSRDPTKWIWYNLCCWLGIKNQISIHPRSRLHSSAHKQ